MGTLQEIIEAFSDADPADLIRDAAAAIAFFASFVGILFIGWGFGA